MLFPDLSKPQLDQLIQTMGQDDVLKTVEFTLADPQPIEDPVPRFIRPVTFAWHDEAITQQMIQTRFEVICHRLEIKLGLGMI
jgi:hypothetical protein